MPTERNLTLPQPKVIGAAGFSALLIGKLVIGGQVVAMVGAMQILTIGVSGLAGFILGWMFSPESRRFRLLALAIITALGLLIAIGDMGVAGISMTGLFSTIAFFAALFYWIGGAVRSFAKPPTTFGSAEWATLPYLEEHGVVGNDGYRLGTFPKEDGQAALHYNSDRHLLTVAPNRSGKGTTLIIPNLLTYMGSALVIDPKGENAMITAERRRAMGQTVHVIDPWGITGEANIARYNPLDCLVPGDPDLSENAMLLADALIVQEGNGDPFWTQEPKGLIQGVVTYVATDEREAGCRHLGRVRDLLLLDDDDMKALFKRMLESPYHVVASTGARCLQKEDRLLSNVLASAQAQTHFLDSPRIRESLSTSDFKFEDLKEQKSTIYLVLPADRLDAFNRWLRLLIQQAITVNARNIAIQPEKPVLFLLDEMPALGRLSMVEQAFGLMAGFGIQLWGIVQDLSQLKGIYGDRYESMISNAGCITYYGSRDRLTAEYFQALCGVTTVWNLSSAIARAFGSSSSSQGNVTTNSSTTYTDTTAASQRQLAYADELMRLPSGKQLIFIENLNPIIAQREGWFRQDELKLLGRNLHNG